MLISLNSYTNRYEYGEMNITKLNQRIDDVEDEIYREKLKIKKVADELGETFDDMIAHYWLGSQKNIGGNFKLISSNRTHYVLPNDSKTFKFIMWEGIYTYWL